MNKDFQELVKIFEYTCYGAEVKVVPGRWTNKNRDMFDYGKLLKFSSE